MTWTRCKERLRDLGPIVVAFSGGADSAFLAWMAHSVLGRHGALAVTAVSASLAPSELADCRSLAAEWDLNYEEVGTHEDARPEYRANGADRCWHCKDELMRCLAPLAASFGASSGGPGARVVLGVNVDDLGDYRPGQAAARDAGAVFPLVETGFTKAEVRSTSRDLGLRTWDKPAAACLASRVPVRHGGDPGYLERRIPSRSRSDRPRFQGAAGTALRRPGQGGTPAGRARARPGASRRGRPCSPGGWLPLRHPRPRGPSVGQPERRPERARLALNGQPEGAG